MEQIEVLADSLRAAVGAEQFAEARRITAEYARRVVERWKAARPGDAEIGRLWGEAQELLNWARATTQAQRAQIGGQLVAIEPLAAYWRSQVTNRRHTLEMEG